MILKSDFYRDSEFDLHTTIAHLLKDQNHAEEAIGTDAVDSNHFELQLHLNAFAGSPGHIDVEACHILPDGSTH